MRQDRPNLISLLGEMRWNLNGIVKVVTRLIYFEMRYVTAYGSHLAASHVILS